MFCPSCGKEISDNNKFCPFCGAPTAMSNQSSPTPSQGSASSYGSGSGYGAGPGYNNRTGNYTGSVSTSRNMSGNGSNVIANLITNKTALIGFIASLLTALFYLLPWGRILYKTVIAVSLAGAMGEGGFIILILIPMLSYLASAALFLFEKPKLALIPSIIGLVMHIIAMAAFGSSLNSTYGATKFYATVPILQLLMGILIIVMAAMSKKSNPNYNNYNNYNNYRRY